MNADQNKTRDELLRELCELRERVPHLEALASEHERARTLQSALYRIADITSAESDMTEFYKELHAIVEKLMYAKNFAIALYDEHADTISFVYFADTVDTIDLAELASIPAETVRYSLSGYVLHTGKPLHVDPDGIAELEKRGAVRGLGADCVDWLGVPLKVGERSIGVLFVQSYVDDIRYSDDDENLLIFVSQHIATALQRKQADEALLKAHEILEQRVQERTAELVQANTVLEEQIQERERAERLQSALYRIADLTSGSTTLEEFYSALHKIIGELMYAENFFIALYHREESSLSFPYFVDKFDSAFPPRKLDTDSLTGLVLTSGKPLLLTRRNRDELDTPKTIGTRSTTWLGVPLKDHDDNIGVLVVQSYEVGAEYTERDKELLTFVSQHIATALRRRRDATELHKAHEALQQSLDELELKVEQRTQELSQANAILQQEIGERRRIEEKLVHDAFHDMLTNLPNRALFIDRLERALVRSERTRDASFSILYLDLDRFKVVNDSLGHMFGDRLLVEVSQRLLTCVRIEDTVARLGGDEFSILLEGASSHENALIVAERILNRLSEPFTLDEHQVFISTSIGITLSSFSYQRAEDVLRDADTAMYHAKAQGKARFAVFDKHLHNQALNRMRLENDLRRALENNEIEPFYQPIIHLESGEVSGFEALARWRHPERGMIPPSEFIPVAEETGIINELGMHMLRRACQQTRYWQELSPAFSRLSISVNVSSQQFTQASLLSDIESVLVETQLAPQSLKLEITESLLMQNFDAAKILLKRLRDMNIRILLDDFGTGYSSLSYLHHFQLNTLKIDRSFVSDLEHHGQHQMIVRTIKTLAASLNLDVIAEGIETEAQLLALKALNCEYGQGYLFAKPLDAMAAKEYLVTRLPRAVG